MVKLNDELKNLIINDLNNKLTHKDISKNRNVSLSSIYRINRELKNNNTILHDNQTIEGNEENQKYEDNQFNEENQMNQSYFNIEELKNELNNNYNSNNKVNNIVNQVNITNQVNQVSEDSERNDNQTNEETDNSEGSEENSQSNEEMQSSDENEEIIKPKVNIKPINNNKPNNKQTKEESYIKPNNTNKPLIDKNLILETMKNCSNNNTIEERQEMISNITKIRTYLRSFNNELHHIWAPNLLLFEKRLFTMQLIQLQSLLDDIRVELNLMKNKEMFDTIVKTSLYGLEKVSGYCNYNIDGLAQDLMNDSSFLYDLKMIQCEIDLSKYINPKQSAFLKVVKGMIQKNQENKMKQEINNVVNNEEVINKIKNLNK